MKAVLLALLLPAVCLGQKPKKQDLVIPVDTTTGKISYTEITYVDSSGKKELFSKALEWIALTYTSEKDVVKFKDRDAGKIIAHGSFGERLEQGSNIYTASVQHDLIIEIKDGKCKIQVTEITYAYGGAAGDLKDFLYANLHKKQNLDFVKRCDSDIRNILSSFSGFMLTKSEAKTGGW